MKKAVPLLLLCLLLLSSVYAAYVTRSDIQGYIQSTGREQDAYIKKNSSGNSTLFNFESPVITGVVQGTLPGIDAAAVLYMHLNNNSAIGESNVLVVDSANVSNGTPVNATVNATGGYLGDGAYNFVDNSSYIDIPHHVLHNTTNITISAWIYPWSNTSGSIVSKDNSSNSKRAWDFTRGSSLKISVIFFNDSTNTQVLSLSNTPSHAWTFVTATWNGSNISIYLNGVYDNSGTLYGRMKANSGTRVTIGKLDTASPSYFNGTIDEPMILNRTMNASDVYNLYLTYVTRNISNFTNSAAVTSFNNSPDYNVSGSNSLKIVYNVTSGSAYWTFNLTGKDLRNYSGIGVWVKGDSTGNRLSWKYVNASGTAFSAQANFVSFYNLTTDDWRYLYLDFHHFPALNNNSVDLANPGYFLLAVNRTSVNTSANGTVYFDDLELVDIMKGAFCYPTCSVAGYGWFYAATAAGSGHLGRLQDAIYPQAWLWQQGGAGFTNNETFLNNSINAGDLLVQFQDPRGLWVENQGDTGGTQWIQTSECLSMALAFTVLENSSRMSDTVTLKSWFTNVTTQTDTRRNHWNRTLAQCGNFVNKASIPALSAAAHVDNQYTVGIIAEYLVYRITGNQSLYTDYVTKVAQIKADIDLFGVEPEKDDAADVAPYYAASYTPVQKNINTLGYFLTRDSNWTDILRLSENTTLAMTGFDGKLMFANSTRGTGAFSHPDTMMTLAVHNLSIEQGFGYLQQSSLASINRFNTTFITGNNSALGYLHPWSFFLPFNYMYYATPSNNSVKFPTMYMNFSYDLLNSTGGFSRRMMNQQTFDQDTFARNVDEFPLHLFAYDDNSSWWIRADLIDANSTAWYYIDQNGNFTLPITPRLNISNGVASWATSTFAPVVNTTRVALTGSGNTRSVSSNLTQSINASISFSTVGIVPSSPRITYPNGSSEYPSYSYENGVMTFSTSLPPGESQLLLIDFEAVAAAQCSAGATYIIQSIQRVINGLAFILLLLIAVIIIGFLKEGYDESFKGLIIGAIIVVLIIAMLIGVVPILC